jgi:thiaminase (transcriptional activator TenA)
MLSSKALATLYPEGGLLARLRDANGDDWRRYISHEFVQQLGNGSLPEPAFRHYLIQDYLFLIHFARAYALAAYKGETLEDLKSAMAAASALVDTEMGLHVGFCAGWGLSEAEMAAAAEDNATLAYTRYVLERGMAGDLLDLHIALAPCVLGYAEIGLALSTAPETKRDKNSYSPWIDMYAGDEYQQVARQAATYIERLAVRRGAEARFDGLTRTFGEATRLEALFWQQGLDAG